MFFVAIYTVSSCIPNANFPVGTEVIEFTRMNGDVSGEIKAVPFRDECKWTGKRSGLSCTKSGRTPLAGSVYVTTKDMKDICDETGKTLVDRLTCVQGCEVGKTPKHIEGYPMGC